MSRALITGGCGLIGRHLVDYLLGQDHDVVVVDDLSNSDEVKEWRGNKSVTFLELDITAPDAAAAMAAMKPFSVVFHLAAHAYEGLSQFCPVLVSNTAVIGTLNVLRAAINAGTVKRCVAVSSMARYGSGELFVPINETVCDGDTAYYIPSRCGPPFGEQKHRESPEDVYGHGKVMAERCVETLCDLHGIEWCHAVPHNVTGPANLKALADPYRGVMLIATNRLLRGLPVIIFSDGSQRRAPSDVQDVVPALAKMGFADGMHGEVINLGGAAHYSITEIARSVRKAFVEVTGRDDPGVQYEPDRPCEVLNAWCSVEKSTRLLGYEDKTSLDDMSRRIVEWAYVVAPNGVEPRYLDKFEIEAKAPMAWVERRM